MGNYNGKQLARALGRRTLRRSSVAGMSLIELMAAMVILLVGVYSVAALFPKLARNITGERDRTTMGRAVDRLAEQMEGGLGGFISAVTPDDINVYAQDIGSSRPEDPDDPGTAPNSRDDFVWVRGEWFTLPAPRASDGLCAYSPKLGLVDAAAGSVIVSEWADLKPAPEDPGVAGTLPHGYYYIRDRKTANAPQDADLGELIARHPQGFPVAFYIADYDWSDATGFTRHMTNDSLMPVPGPDYLQVGPPASGRQRAGWPRMANSKVSAFRLVPATVDTYGQCVLFPGDLAGRRLRMDYRLRTDTGRRIPVMSEDVTFPVASAPHPLSATDAAWNLPTWKIKLSLRNLDPDEPLADTDPATGLPIPDVYVIVVDLNTGRTWIWNSIMVSPPVPPGPAALPAPPGDGIWDVDMKNGVITLGGAGLNDIQGAPLRIYYRTVNGHFIQVQKAPLDMLERDPLVAPRTPDWVHRSYVIGSYTGASADVFTLLHSMPAYCEDQSVQVDYMTVDDPTDPDEVPRLTTGELHVVTDMGGGWGYGVVLNRANVKAVLKVRGASAKVCGWWRQDDGRVDMVDLSTMLFGQS